MIEDWSTGFSLPERERDSAGTEEEQEAREGKKCLRFHCDQTPHCASQRQSRRQAEKKSADRGGITPQRHLIQPCSDRFNQICVGARLQWTSGFDFLSLDAKYHKKNIAENT